MTTQPPDHGTRPAGDRGLEASGAKVGSAAEGQAKLHRGGNYFSLALKRLQQMLIPQA
jgi:hypothetical protein